MRLTGFAAFGQKTFAHGIPALPALVDPTRSAFLSRLQAARRAPSGGYTRGMTEPMREMEAREDVLQELLSREPIDIPDIHPNVSEIHRRKVKRLSEALSSPQDRAEASAAIRALVEKIELRPGPNRGEIDATLRGDLSTILGWIEAQGLETLERVRF